MYYLRIDNSSEEQNRKTSSGAPIHESRTGWAITWLYDAGCIARVGRGIYAITEKLCDTSPMECLDVIVKEMYSQLSHEIMNAIMSLEGRVGDSFKCIYKIYM